jgi:hypothetical protein
MEEIKDMLLKNKNIKVIYARPYEGVGDLRFLFQKGWAKRAGIIPYTVEDGKYYLLLGEKYEDGKITDFGGGCSQYEEPIVCGYREFLEETRSSFPIDFRNFTHIVITGKKGPHQVIILVKMDKRGNEEIRFLEMSHKNDKKSKKGVKELSDIEWFELGEARNERLSDSLRSMFEYLVF